MYKYSKSTNQFIQMPEVPADAINVSDEVVAQARVAVESMLPFVVINENTISVAPSAKHQYDEKTGTWYYWAYKYSASADTFYSLDLLASYDLPEDAIDVDDSVHLSVVAARGASLSYVVLSSTEVSVAPSAAFDWDAKKKAWVENALKVAAIAAAAAAALIPKVVSMAQAQLSLLDAGYLDDVESYMKSDSVSREAKIYWSKSTVVRRDDATVALMQGLLKLSDSDIDTLFVLAAKK